METINNNNSIELELLNIFKDFENNSNATDLHLNGDSVIRIRQNGDIEIMRNEEVSVEKMKEFVDYILSTNFKGEDLSRKKEELNDGETDLGLNLPNGNRSRAVIAKSINTYSIVMRKIPNKLPNIDNLGFNPKHLELLKKNSVLKEGLILITGQTGSGKTTTLAGILNYVSKNYKKHIITLEDPIEYVFDRKDRNRKSFVLQREIGNNTTSFISGLRTALREDPDVIMIGEIRDEETAKKALEAAETGHIVLSTLHTNSASEAVSRLLGMFPQENETQIRKSLATTLKMVISQKLPPKIGSGRALVYELLLNNQSISNIIEKGDYSNIHRTLRASREAGMITMEDNLLELFQKNIISTEVALEYANQKQDLEKKISGIGITPIKTLK